MARNLDKIKATAEAIKDVDRVLEYLEKHEMTIRVGHSGHSYSVKGAVDATLLDIVKKNMEINLRLNKAKLERDLASLAGGANV